MSDLPRTNFFPCKRWLSATAWIFTVVFCCAALSPAVPSAAGEFQPGRDLTKLPPPVQRMRQAILQACASGGIEKLRLPIDMNEIPPVFGKGNERDPIAYFKAVSADGQGREILAILYNILTTGYAVLNPGTKDEMFVWPYHAAIPPASLTPSQEVELYRFVSPARYKEMVAGGKYNFYSAGITPDGVWHYFTPG